MSNTYDAVVIGAGIMGCSTAYQLSRRGLKVAVVEKSTISAGSTGSIVGNNLPLSPSTSL